jgi:hypothetical protein
MGGIRSDRKQTIQLAPSCNTGGAEDTGIPRGILPQGTAYGGREGNDCVQGTEMADGAHAKTDSQSSAARKGEGGSLGVRRCIPGARQNTTDRGGFGKLPGSTHGIKSRARVSGVPQTAIFTGFTAGTERSNGGGSWRSVGREGPRAPPPPRGEGAGAARAEGSCPSVPVAGWPRGRGPGSAEGVS